MRAAVLTVSDRSAAGDRPDTGGPIAVAALRDAGYDCEDAVVIADGEASVRAGLEHALATGARLIVTTGGTGVAPRDQTPEGTASVIEREIPGIPEELRRRAAGAPGALLSRGLAGTVGSALIVNLPGSPKAVTEGISLVISVAAHTLAQLDGGDHG